MSFRHAMAVITASASIAVGGMSLAFAADPPTQPAANTKSDAPAQSAPAQTTGTPASAPSSQPQGSPAPGQTEVATAPAAPTVATKPGDAAAGQGKAGVCAACHGLDGNPASSQYPKLAGQHEDYIARQLELYKSRQRNNPIMAGFAAALQPQDMHDIGAFFATKASLPGVADAALVKRGEAIYRGGDKTVNAPACMACHGPDGRGNPGAGYPQLGGQYGDYVAQRLKDWRDGKTFGDDDRSKIMPVVAKNLSDADIAALSSYVEGLHSAEADNTAAK